MSNRLLTPNERDAVYRVGSITDVDHRMRVAQDAKTEPLVRADERRKMAELLHVALDNYSRWDLHDQLVIAICALEEQLRVSYHNP